MEKVGRDQTEKNMKRQERGEQLIEGGRRATLFIVKRERERGEDFDEHHRKQMCEAICTAF